MKKIKIYIVEDDKLTRITYTHYFKNTEEIEVLDTFETAEECLSAMRENPADVILMDLGLPCMNGIEATKLVKQDFPATKVIVLTSHDKTEGIYASLALGANAYALKDIEPIELVEVIKNVQKGVLWVDPKMAQTALKAFPQPHDINNMANLYLKDESIKLSGREIQVLKLLVQGKSNVEIAAEMGVTLHTSKAHVARIFDKLEVRDRVQATVKAIEYNLLI